MKKSFREHHLLQVLEGYEGQTLPMDVYLSNYFRRHTAVGAGDRRHISEMVYGLIRWRGLLDHLIPKPPSWEARAGRFREIKPHDYHKDLSIPPHIRASFPKELFHRFAQHFGEERTLELCLVSNTPAPTTVRVNALKISREELFAKWKDLYDVSLCEHSPWAIRFHKKINFFALAEFKEGLFEIQDEASQLVAALVEANPGDQVLDFCAGSGGKTLAIAPRMKEKGQLFLHDIRTLALQEAKKRLRRAGIQNAQVIESSKLSSLKGRMDWVLVDSPCSGTGTLRRNPDMKWKMNLADLPSLLEEQRMIFKQALEYLHPKGRIVYATCSILPEENREQAAYFQKEFNLELVGPIFETFPSEGGMDGFFGATFALK